MTNALTTTVEIVPNYENQKGPRFSVSNLPVATPFNYLDQGLKFMVHPLVVDKGFIAEWAEVLDLNDNHMETMTAMRGHYTQKPRHQFVEDNSGDYMFFRFKDTRETPITDVSWGETDYLSTKLSRFIDLHAAWYEVGSMHGLASKVGNIVIDVIMTYENVKRLMEKAYDKNEEAKEVRKTHALPKSLLNVNIKNIRGNQLFQPTDNPAVTPSGVITEGFKQMKPENPFYLYGSIADNIDLNILLQSETMLAVYSTPGEYDRDKHEFTESEHGDYLFARFIQKKGKISLNEDWETNIIERFIGGWIAQQTVWYEAAVLPDKAKMQINVDGKVLPAYPTDEDGMFSICPTHGSLVIDLLIVKED